MTIEEESEADGERTADAAVEFLVLLVKTFAKCRNLKFHLLNTGERGVPKDTIHQICGSLPCREAFIDVRIGSTVY